MQADLLSWARLRERLDGRGIDAPQWGSRSSSCRMQVQYNASSDFSSRLDWIGLWGVTETGRQTAGSVFYGLQMVLLTVKDPTEDLVFSRMLRVMALEGLGRVLGIILLYSVRVFFVRRIRNRD